MPLVYSLITSINLFFGLPLSRRFPSVLILPPFAWIFRHYFFFYHMSKPFNVFCFIFPAMFVTSKLPLLFILSSIQHSSNFSYHTCTTLVSLFLQLSLLFSLFYLMLYTQIYISLLASQQFHKTFLFTFKGTFLLHITFTHYLLLHYSLTLYFVHPYVILAASSTILIFYWTTDP